MKLLFTGISVLLLLLAIASFVTAIAYLLPVIEFTVPGMTSLPVKEAIGTVTSITARTSSSRSASTGRTTTTSHVTATIQFHDESGHLFQITCDPLFKSFKEKSKVKILYSPHSSAAELANEYAHRADSIDAGLAKENAQNGTQLHAYRDAVGVSGIPKSLFYWLERPITFLIIGIVLLLLRIPAGLFKNTYQ